MNQDRFRKRGESQGTGGAVRTICSKQIVKLDIAGGFAYVIGLKNGAVCTTEVANEVR